MEKIWESLNSQVFWGFISLIALAFAFSGKLSVSAARFCLMLAWGLSVLMIARWLYTYNFSGELYFLCMLLSISLVGLALYPIYVWVDYKNEKATSLLPSVNSEDKTNKKQTDLIENQIDVDVTPSYLVGVYRDHTEPQANDLVKNFSGARMTVSGILSEVRIIGGDYYVQTYVSGPDGKDTLVNMNFDHKWDSRIKVLTKNTRIKVRGNIGKVTAYWVELINCEILTENELQTEAKADEKKKRIFVGANITPVYLMSLSHEPGRTSAQAAVLVEPFMNKWMRVSGVMSDVNYTYVEGERSFVTMTFKKDSSIDPTTWLYHASLYMYFRKDWIDRLLILKPGDQLTVIGKIDKVYGYNVSLDFCELEDSQQK
jgi:hypothetical protein